MDVGTSQLPPAKPRFTSVNPKNCSRCRRPLKPGSIKCVCGEFLLKITLQPKQRAVVDLVRAIGPDVATKIGFGGSRGSAKSRLARDLALFVAFTVPGVTIFLIRRNWGDLEENHLEKLKLERPELTQYYSGSRQAYEFPPDLGGSRIAFKYGDTFDDIRRVGRGPEGYLIIIDQAEQFSELELAELNTPNRWPDVPQGAAKTVYLFNPGGAGTDYLRRVFYLKQYRGEERSTDYAFIQAYGWDNFEWFRGQVLEVPRVCTAACVAECGGVLCGCVCHQPAEALTFESFYGLPGELPDCPTGVYDSRWLETVAGNHRFKLFVTRTSEGRKMWAKPEAIRMGDLFGRFDKFAGQYFAGVWDERLCVLPAAKVDNIVPFWWTCWMSGDWGFGHHASVYWFVTGKISPAVAWDELQIDTKWPLDVVIVYRELVVNRLAEPELGRKVVQMTPEPERAEIRRWVMGSDVFMADRKSPHTISELIDAVTVPAGLPALRRAQDKSGSRVINARLMYEMLRRTVSMRGENPPTEKPEERAAPLLFVSAECPGLVDAVPLLLADEDKPDDVKKLETVHDDVFDGCKYGCAEYLAVRGEAPREVRRQEAVDSAGLRADSVEERNTMRYMRALKFDADENENERRVRRR